MSKGGGVLHKVLLLPMVVGSMEFMLETACAGHCKKAMSLYPQPCS